MALLYKADPTRGEIWKRVLADRAPDLEVRLWPDVGDPRDIRLLLAWEPPEDPIAAFPNLEMILSVSAGVDQFDFSRIPPEVPVVRMLDPNIVEGMVSYVAMAVLALHRDLPTYIDARAEGRWHQIANRPAAARRIGILGAGRLGSAVLAALAPFGFPLAVWARTPREMPGAEVFAGAEGLDAFLARTDILVCLLPLTEETRGILGAATFSRLPEGASIVNVGRGGHLVTADLVAALDSGRLSAAILDVADAEPPPPDHPFWTHPRILLTPHIASHTRPETAVDAVLDAIRRHRAGETPIGLVSRDRGY